MCCLFCFKVKCFFHNTFETRFKRIFITKRFKHNNPAYDEQQVARVRTITVPLDFIRAVRAVNYYKTSRQCRLSPARE